MAKVIPGPSGRFLFGNALQVDSGHYHMTLWKWKEEFGQIYQFRVFRKNVIVISDIDLMKKAFDIEDLCHRPDNFANVLMYNGSGVVSANFSEQQRVLKGMVWEVLYETHEDPELKKLFDKELLDFVDALVIGEDINLHETLTQSIARQMAAQFIGSQTSEAHSSAVVNFLDATNELYRNGRELILTMFPWLRHLPGSLKRVTQTLHETQSQLVKMFVQQARDTYKEGAEHCILHRLFAKQKVENEKRGSTYITEENLYSCILELLMASVLPLSQHIEFAVLSAVVNPDMQEKIYQEINQVGSVHSLSVKKLPYFQAFVFESFRYFSMVLITVPRFVSKETVINGYTFQKDSLLLGSLYNLHHDDKTWGDPWVFRPERFLNEDGELLPATAQPMKSLKIFGFGIRDCKAKEESLKIVNLYLLYIFSNYKITSPLNTELPSFNPNDYNTVTVINMPSFKCRFEKRKLSK